MGDIAHTPLAESERESLRRHAGEVDWAMGVLIDSAVWNVERLEAQLAGTVDALRRIAEEEHLHEGAWARMVAREALEEMGLDPSTAGAVNKKPPG